MNTKFSKEQTEVIDDLVLWTLLLKDEPEYTNRLKIWAKLRLDGAEGYLLLEAFRKTGLL